MSFTDDLLTRIAASPQLDPAASALLTPFIESNRAFLDRLGPSATSALFSAISAGSPAPWSALLASMDQSQLLALMNQTESILDSQIALRAAAMARLQTFTHTATDLALRLLAATLLGLL